MDREMFLYKLFRLYASSFNESNKQVYWDAYKTVLSEKLDYDRLYSTMLSEYAGAAAPKAAWLKQKAVIKQSAIETEKPVYSTIKCKKWGTEYLFSFDMKQDRYEDVKNNLIKRGLEIVSA